MGSRIFWFISLLIFIAFSCAKDASNQTDFISSGLTETLDTLDIASDYFDEDFEIVVQKLDDPRREYWQNPDLVVDKLGDIEGKTVADIGVGTGYFAFKIANRAERVIAIDVEAKFLEYIEERKFELGSRNLSSKIETRLCEVDDPNMFEQESDLALLIDTYHFIDNRIEYLQKIWKGLKSNGDLLLVDYKQGDLPIGPPNEVKVDRSSALKELETAGFSITEVDTTSLQFQYIIKATKQL